MKTEMTSTSVMLMAGGYWTYSPAMMVTVAYHTPWSGGYVVKDIQFRFWAVLN